MNINSKNEIDRILALPISYFINSSKDKIL